MRDGELAREPVEGVDVVTYPRDRDWEDEVNAAIDRDYPDDAVALAEEALVAQNEAMALSIREFYGGGVAPLPDGVVPERVEVTAAYPCGCPEVADITEEMLDRALKGARLKGLLEMYDCRIPEEAFAAQCEAVAVDVEQYVMKEEE